MSEHLDTDLVARLAEELWADSASPGAAPTDAHRDIARAVLASDWLAERIAAAQAEALEGVAADLYRNHDMPPNKDGRSYSYRNGWWDGVHHAAATVKRAGRTHRYTPGKHDPEGGA